MSYLYTIRGGFEPMRIGDVTAADTALTPTTNGYTFSWEDKPSHAYQLRPEHNAVQIIFTGGWDYVKNASGGWDASSEQGCSFELYGYPPGGPAIKICDGSVHCHEVYLDSTSRSADATHGFYCSSINLDDEPHPTSIVVSNVDSTTGIAVMTLDTLGYEYMSVQFPDVSFAVQAWIRPY